MIAGELDSRISFWRNCPTTDDANADVDDWIEQTKPGGVAASYAPVADGESVRSQQAQAAITDRFQVRWSQLLSQIEPLTWRVKFDGVTYDIVRKKNLGTRGRQRIEISARAQAIAPVAQ
jgi:head-tail adaptor